MAPDHIPPGFHALTPYLSVEDAPAFLEFLQAAFDAERGMDHRDETGKVVHAEVRIAGCMLEFSEARGSRWPATRAWLHLFVPNPDAAFARAIAAGAEESYPVTDHPYGERSGGVADRWGNQWFLARVTDLAARNMT